MREALRAHIMLMLASSVLVPSVPAVSMPDVPITAAGAFGSPACVTTVAFEAYPNAPQHPGVATFDRCGDVVWSIFEGGECDNWCSGQSWEQPDTTVECISGLDLPRAEQVYLRLDPDGHFVFTSWFGFNVEARLIRAP